MTDEGMIKCKHCNYKGHLPLLTKHLFMAHNIVYTE